MSGRAAGGKSLRRQIDEATAALGKIGEPAPDSPELTDTANLIRANDTLARSGAKKSELIALYAEYAGALEGIIDSVLDVQSEITGILRQGPRPRAPARRAKPRRRQGASPPRRSKAQARRPAQSRRPSRKPRRDRS